MSSSSRFLSFYREMESSFIPLEKVCIQPTQLILILAMDTIAKQSKQIVINVQSVENWEEMHELRGNRIKTTSTSREEKYTEQDWSGHTAWLTSRTNQDEIIIEHECLYESSVVVFVGMQSLQQQEQH